MFIVFGHKEVVGLLIAKGVYVNAKYAHGRTMLDLAMDKLTFDEVTIPESSSVTLLGMGSLAVLLRRRRN